MILPAHAHVIVLDGERFLLMQNVGTATEPRLEMAGQPDLELTNYSAGVRHQDENDQAPTERLGRYAHAAAVGEWLNHAVLNHTIKKVLIIASPDTLGEMRRHYHKETQAVLLGEIDRQLTGMAAPEIMRAIEAA